MSASWSILEMAARRRNNLGPEWEMFSGEVLPHRPAPGTSVVYKVGMGVPRLLTKGPRKGQKKWGGQCIDDWIPEAEVDAEKALYERETGNCHVCLGSGQVAVRWSVDAGTEYKPCGRCMGKGRVGSES